MYRSLRCWLLLGILTVAGPLAAQQPLPPGGVPTNGSYTPLPQGQTAIPGGNALVQPLPQPGAPLLPDQPVAPPQAPTLQQHLQQNNGLRQLPPPIQLSPQEQAELDRALRDWEGSSSRIKTFSCVFDRKEFDPTHEGGVKPRLVDKGQIEFEAPDKGLFAIEGQQPERWVCNGKSIFEFNYITKVITEHQLPPELQGKAIANGPLPFLFGSSAEDLKRRYFLKVITPAEARSEQVWITGFPRFQADAANFSQANIVLGLRNMQPIGLQLFPPGRPGGAARTEYLFDRVTINPLLGMLRSSPFTISKPNEQWKFIVEPAPTAQVQRPAGPSGQPLPR